MNNGLERRAAARSILASLLTRDRHLFTMALGYGSFFREDDHWHDVDLIYLLNDSTEFRKGRVCLGGVTFDIGWCGLEGIENSLYQASKFGRQHFAHALATSVLLAGDDELHRHLAFKAQSILDSGPAATAQDHLAYLTFFLSTVIDSISRMSAVDQVSLIMESYEISLHMISLSRDCWIVPYKYRELKTGSVLAAEEKLRVATKSALNGEIKFWVRLIESEIGRVGGKRLCWP